MSVAECPELSHAGAVMSTAKAEPRRTGQAATPSRVANDLLGSILVSVDIMSPSTVNLDNAIHRIPSIISCPVTPIDPAWICESK